MCLLCLDGQGSLCRGGSEELGSLGGLPAVSKAWPYRQMLCEDREGSPNILQALGRGANDTPCWSADG